MDKLLELVKKHWDILVYLFFGVLTTVVNYLVYLPLYNLLNVSAALSNVIAWVISVVFAFFTNKPFVFKSRNWSSSVVIPEFLKFISCRVGSGAIETIIIFLTIDILGFDGNLMKFLTSIVVVILNYFGSKFLVFRKQTPE